MKKVLPLLVLVPFFAFSVLVAIEHGALGFLSVAGKEPWGLQMLLDLSIALFLVGGWLRRDAKKFGINAVPYLILLVLVGSIGALVYLVHRNFFAKVIQPEGSSLLAADGRGIARSEGSHGHAT